MRSQTNNRYHNTALPTRSLWACVIALALVLTTGGPRPASAVSATTQSMAFSDPAGAPLLPGTFHVISNEPGNQTNPHVDCNIASYTSDDLQGHSTVHYQDLSSGVDNIIPGNEVDLLSDVSGQPPSGNESEINDLISLIGSFNLPPGTSNSLITKLQDALAAFETSDTATVCISLTAFINECQAQSDKKLTPGTKHAIDYFGKPDQNGSWLSVDGLSL